MSNHWYLAMKDNLAKGMKQIYRDPNTPVVEGEIEPAVVYEDDLIQVTPTIAQSKEDHEANMRFDEARDNELQDQENINAN